MVSSAIADHELVLHEAFEKFDIKKDGRLDLEEVYAALKWLGLRPTPQDAMLFLQNADRDHDGQISFRDFQTGVTELTPANTLRMSLDSEGFADKDEIDFSALLNNGTVVGGSNGEKMTVQAALEAAQRELRAQTRALEEEVAAIRLIEKKAMEDADDSLEEAKEEEDLRNPVITGDFIHYEFTYNVVRKIPFLLRCGPTEFLPDVAMKDGARSIIPSAVKATPLPNPEEAAPVPPPEEGEEKKDGEAEGSSKCEGDSVCVKSGRERKKTQKSMKAVSAVPSLLNQNQAALQNSLGKNKNKRNKRPMPSGGKAKRSGLEEKLNWKLKMRKKISQVAEEEEVEPAPVVKQEEGPPAGKMLVMHAGAYLRLDPILPLAGESAPIAKLSAYSITICFEIAKYFTRPIHLFKFGADGAEVSIHMTGNVCVGGIDFGRIVSRGVEAEYLSDMDEEGGAEGADVETHLDVVEAMSSSSESETELLDMPEVDDDDELFGEEEAALASAEVPVPTKAQLQRFHFCKTGRFTVLTVSVDLQEKEVAVFHDGVRLNVVGGDKSGRLLEVGGPMTLDIRNSNAPEGERSSEGGSGDDGESSNSSAVTPSYLYVGGNPCKQGGTPVRLNVRNIRVDRQPIWDDEEVLRLHVAQGVWQCRGCGMRNAQSTETCLSCYIARVMSAVPPPNNMDPDHPGLTVVTASTFEALVLQSPEHVFIAVSADWCGPCRAMKPSLYSLAKELEGHKDFKICVMDADANYINRTYFPETHVPNIKLFVKGNKHAPVGYPDQSPRGLTHFKEFLEDETGVKMEEVSNDKFDEFRKEFHITGLVVECVLAYIGSESQVGPLSFAAAYFMDGRAYQEVLAKGKRTVTKEQLKMILSICNLEEEQNSEEQQSNLGDAEAMKAIAFTMSKGIEAAAKKVRPYITSVPTGDHDHAKLSDAPKLATVKEALKGTGLEKEAKGKEKEGAADARKKKEQEDAAAHAQKAAVLRLYLATFLVQHPRSLSKETISQDPTLDWIREKYPQFDLDGVITVRRPARVFELFHRAVGAICSGAPFLLQAGNIFADDTIDDVRVQRKRTLSEKQRVARAHAIDTLVNALQDGLDPNATPAGCPLIVYAAASGLLPAVQILAYAECDVHLAATPTSASSSLAFPITAIEVAAAMGHLDVVQWLAKNGGAVSCTVPHMAAAFAQAHVLLWASKAMPGSLNAVHHHSGLTPIMIAAMTDQDNSCQTLRSLILAYPDSVLTACTSTLNPRARAHLNKGEDLDRVPTLLHVLSRKKRTVALRLLTSLCAQQNKASLIYAYEQPCRRRPIEDAPVRMRGSFLPRKHLPIELFAKLCQYGDSASAKQLEVVLAESAKDMALNTYAPVTVRMMGGDGTSLHPSMIAALHGHVDTLKVMLEFTLSRTSRRQYERVRLLSLCEKSASEKDVSNVGASNAVMRPAQHDDWQASSAIMWLHYLKYWEHPRAGEALDFLHHAGLLLNANDTADLQRLRRACDFFKSDPSNLLVLCPVTMGGEGVVLKPAPSFRLDMSNYVCMDGDMFKDSSALRYSVQSVLRVAERSRRLPVTGISRPRFLREPPPHPLLAMINGSIDMDKLIKRDGVSSDEDDDTVSWCDVWQSARIAVQVQQAEGAMSLSPVQAAFIVAYLKVHLLSPTYFQIETLSTRLHLHFPS